MNGLPEISVIVPVYNADNYLEKTLNSILNQKFRNFELICVNDGSTDSSMEILKLYEKKDSRVVLLQQKKKGAGAARNFGFSIARGKYLIFLDSDALFSEELLLKTYEAAEKHQADIVAFNYSRFEENGKEIQCHGVHDDWLPQNIKVFNYKDCPYCIMTVISPVPWNKLYRRDFVEKNNLKFEEISSTNDITLAAVSLACAERITYILDSLVRYRSGHSGTISSTKGQKLDNVVIAVMSAVRKVRELSYSKIIENSIKRFIIDNFVYAFRDIVTDLSDMHAETFYRFVHELFTKPEFEEFEFGDIGSSNQILLFGAIKRHDYDQMLKLTSRKIVVSLTTYPKRIHTLSKVLDTIFSQTRKADEIVLWLAEEQFPKKEADIPNDLQKLVQEGRLTIRWCDDLKPHKKYFYALQECSEDLIVTIDDDLLYSDRLLENLFECYLCYPEAVSSVRAHLIVIDENQKILPYDDWIKETDVCLYQPSMQLMATGGAGTLYPPGIFSKDLFCKEAILETCLWADDLWLKTMQLISDVPVVVAQPFESLRYLPGSQSVALYRQNVDQKQNDVQLIRINEWLNKHYEQDILIKKLTTSDIGVKILGIEALCENFANERKVYRKNIQQLHNKLQKTYDEKFERGLKIRELEAELSSLRKINKLFQVVRCTKIYKILKEIYKICLKVYRRFRVYK